MQDLYQAVTDRIIESLEAGVAPWVRPWNSTELHGGNPYNAVSGKAYRGINVALLYAPEFPTAAWLTFKQAKDLGGNVRKGAHGRMIVFYKPFAVKDRNALPDADGNVREKLIPLLKCFHVFNIAQCENLPERLSVTPTPREPLPAHSLMDKATVHHGGDLAAYSPSHDIIRLPHPEQFASPAEYQATALHELTHWSGHATRLAREYGKRFGDQAYAREELVAEMGAAFLCARCGIDGRLQHPEYIAQWLKVLKQDKRAVMVAASHAQKAADFILGEQPEAEQSMAA